MSDFCSCCRGVFLIIGLGFELRNLGFEKKTSFESKFLDDWLFRWTFTGENFKDAGH